MRNKVKSIKEKVPQESTLPDGCYNGVWGGYIIELGYKGKTYQLETEEGVRGVGFKVIVQVKDGVATFDELNN
jgi:hypothetical protein